MTLFYFTGDHSGNTISPKLEVYMVLNDESGEKILSVRGGKFNLRGSLKSFLRQPLNDKVEC